jgi:uncharacterized protein with GYD domain
MPYYVLLMNLTKKGVAEIKDAPVRVAEAAKAGEAIGGKMLAFYMVMGEYDYVAIAEGTDDETMATFILGLAKDGYVRTKTLKAFTLEEFTGIVAKLP